MKKLVYFYILELPRTLASHFCHKKNFGWPSHLSPTGRTKAVKIGDDAPLAKVVRCVTRMQKTSPTPLTDLTLALEERPNFAEF